MPPKRLPSFVWDEEKNLYLLDCFDKAKTASCATNVHGISKEMLKLFLIKFPEYALAGGTLYKYFKSLVVVSTTTTAATESSINDLHMLSQHSSNVSSIANAYDDVTNANVYRGTCIIKKPKKKLKYQFIWDDSKKSFLLDCFSKLKTTEKNTVDITNELQKQFSFRYSDCKLAKNTLYAHAKSLYDGKKQFTGRTKHTFWTDEKDAFLLECIERAKNENQRLHSLGFFAGKVGLQGKYSELLTQYFQEKYKDISKSAIKSRIAYVQKINKAKIKSYKRIVVVRH